MEGRDRSESRRGRLRSITPAPSSLPWVEEVRLLEKVGDPLSLVLWRQLRVIQVWASAPADERAQLFQARRDGDEDRFTAACGAGAGLQEPFAAFARLRNTPAEVDAEEIAAACLQVYTWAEAEGYPGAALLFAEAGAAVSPSDPVFANNAGWMCRRAEFKDRSAAWYHRAFGLAVRTSDHTEAIRGMLGYGALMKGLARYDEARRYYERAAARAMRTGRRRQAAAAHHYLLALAAETGNLLQAMRHVRLALEMYPHSDRRLPALGHDWAYVLVTNQLFTPAVAILECVLPHINQPEEQLLVQAILARSQAAAGDRNAFENAAARLSRLLDEQTEFSAAALVHLGEGALAIGDRERAECHALRAIEQVDQNRDPVVMQLAVDLSERIDSNETVPVESDAPLPEQMERIAKSFERRLRSYQSSPGDSGAVLTASLRSA
jgi:tetratricopeptide (TPR) repeat protein